MSDKVLPCNESKRIYLQSKKNLNKFPAVKKNRSLQLISLPNLF